MILAILGWMGLIGGVIWLIKIARDERVPETDEIILNDINKKREN